METSNNQEYYRMAKIYGRLVVDKLDEVYLSVSTEDSIRKELSEFFKFKVPGAEFIPAVRKRFWDGYIRLFNLQKNQIYMGLYPYLKEFCEDRDYELDGWEPETDIFTIERYEEIVQDIPLELRDYQKEAVAYAAHNRKCILVSPTASGKSLMIYSLIRYNFLKKNGKALIIVPTTSLVEQMAKDFKDYGFNGNIQKLDNEGKVNIVKFEKTSFNIAEISTKSISEPKMQETPTIQILRCLQSKNIVLHNCNPTKKTRMDTKIEINKRFGMPFYIPLLSLICCFLLESRRDKKLHHLNKYICFFIGFLLLIAAEVSV